MHGTETSLTSSPEANGLLWTGGRGWAKAGEGWLALPFLAELGMHGPLDDNNKKV